MSISPQSNGDTVNAFKQGQIDGAWVPEPYATQLVNAGGKVLKGPLRAATDWTPVPRR